MPSVRAKIAVIIPAFGNPDLLLNTLHSVFNQQGNLDLKVIVVDDHSPVPLKPIVSRHFPQALVIRNRTNLRSGPARNQALAHISDAKYIAFLDADDIWSPTFLNESVKNITKNRAIASLSFTHPLFDQGINSSFKLRVLAFSLTLDLLKLLFYHFNHKTIPQSAFALCHLSHLLFRARAVSGLRFDSQYNHGGEDWKYTLEAMDRGKIAILPKQLVRFRYHLRSTTRLKENILNKWTSYSQLFSELSKRGLNDPMVWLFRLYIRSFQPTNR